MNSAVSLDNPGEVEFRRSCETNWQTWITRADPVVVMNGETLAAALNGQNYYWVPSHLSLEAPADTTPCYCTGVPLKQHSQCWVGWKVSVIADNLTYVYIVKHFDAQHGLWVGAWPD